MGFANFILFFFFYIFVSATPVPDIWTHYVDPTCRPIAAISCSFVVWCQYYRDKKNIFTKPGGSLVGRDISNEREGFLSERDDPESGLKNTTREFDVNWKRSPFPRSVLCGYLSFKPESDLSNRFDLVAEVLYDFS